MSGCVCGGATIPREALDACDEERVHVARDEVGGLAVGHARYQLVIAEGTDL